MLETMCIALAKDLLRLSAHPDGSQLSVTPAPWRLLLLVSEGARTTVHTPHVYTQFKQTNKHTKIQLQSHAEETSLQTGGGRDPRDSQTIGVSIVLGCLPELKGKPQLWKTPQTSDTGLGGSKLAATSLRTGSS